MRDASLTESPHDAVFEAVADHPGSRPTTLNDCGVPICGAPSRLAVRRLVRSSPTSATSLWVSPLWGGAQWRTRHCVHHSQWAAATIREIRLKKRRSSGRFTDEPGSKVAHRFSSLFAGCKPRVNQLRKSSSAASHTSKINRINQLQSVALGFTIKSLRLSTLRVSQPHWTMSATNCT
jgi:hypothetical protein